MPSMIDFAMRMINNNPTVQGNPRAQELLSVIQSGDSKRGEEIARNLCQSYGVTPEQAQQQARQYFNL